MVLRHELSSYQLPIRGNYINGDFPINIEYKLENIVNNVKVLNNLSIDRNKELKQIIDNVKLLEINKKKILERKWKIFKNKINEEVKNIDNKILYLSNILNNIKINKHLINTFRKNKFSTHIRDKINNIKIDKDIILERLKLSNSVTQYISIRDAYIVLKRVSRFRNLICNSRTYKKEIVRIKYNDEIKDLENEYKLLKIRYFYIKDMLNICSSEQNIINIIIRYYYYDCY